MTRLFTRADTCKIVTAHKAQIIMEIFTDSNRNRLTAAGNAYVVEWLQGMAPERRAVVIIRATLGDLYAAAKSGKQVDSFCGRFLFLREKMRTFKWSKEFVAESFGVEFNVLKKLYFSLTD